MAPKTVLHRVCRKLHGIGATVTCQLKRDNQLVAWSLLLFFVLVIKPSVCNALFLVPGGSIVSPFVDHDRCLQATACNASICANGSTCSVQNFYNCVTCICPDGFKGVYCDEVDDGTENRTEVGPVWPPVQPRFPKDMNTTCTQRNDTLPSDGNCNGMPCYNGWCNLIPLNSSSEPGAIEIRCECDPTWIGDDCGTCCDLTCEDDEVCVAPDGEKKCRPIYPIFPTAPTPGTVSKFSCKCC